jgi:uncharacterized protein (TIGR04255 family)
MGKKMNNAPVYFTVAQVRFNAYLNLDGHLPSIQEAMRLAGFPDFKPSQFQQLVMPFSSGGGGQPAVPTLVPQARCTFGDMVGTSNFILENSALAFQTTAYDTFETFSETFLKGLKIVNDVLKLSFSERIGLRYLDAVLPVNTETLKDYLVPEVLGLSAMMPNLVHSFSETLTVNSYGHTVSRVIIKQGQVGLTPELAIMAPPINQKFSDFNGLHAILDTDAFSEQRLPFDLSSIEKILGEQKKSIRSSFDVTVTPYALNIWNLGGV